MLATDLELPATTLVRIIGHADAGVSLKVYAKDARDERRRDRRTGASVFGRDRQMKVDCFSTIERAPDARESALVEERHRFQRVLRERATGLEPATFSLEG